MAIPVVAAEARQRPVAETLSLVGSLLANEQVEIKAETEGIVSEIHFREGQAVARGDLLLVLDETKFATALAEAESSFELSRATFERARQLVEDRLISQQEFDQASAGFKLNEATVARRRRELKDARVYAPFDGLVGARSISPGQVITPATLLTTLIDLDPVKVEISVPERFLGQIRAGQELELSVASFPGRKFKGEVYFVAPGVDPATRTALVKALIPNPQQQLRPGMFANLDLTLQVRDNAIVIPESALVLTQDKTSVWVIGEGEVVQARPVTVGLRMAGNVEITYGLADGERVVVEGVQKVMPGARVQPSGREQASRS